MIVAYRENDIKSVRPLLAEINVPVSQPPLSRGVLCDNAFRIPTDHLTALPMMAQHFRQEPGDSKWAVWDDQRFQADRHFSDRDEALASVPHDDEFTGSSLLG